MPDFYLLAGNLKDTLPMATDDINVSKKIVWLASYPKSGNTWFRAFLTALLNNGALDINEMKTDGIYSSRQIFNQFTDLDSADWYPDEVKAIQPEVYKVLASQCGDDLLYIKIHDAYTYNQFDRPIVPQEATRCAIYIIRNPLSIAASLANFNNLSIDAAIDFMNDPKSILAKQNMENYIPRQLEQYLLDWSGHVKSWTSHFAFQVMVLRYEDMLSDTFNTFNAAINFLGIKTSKTEIENAIRVSGFEQLQQKERERGFKERVKANTVFFRKGEAEAWRDELDQDQIDRITAVHQHTMAMYHYCK